jgi:hypothetical protein
MFDGYVANMIAKENTNEYDLVPCVTALTNLELTGSTTKVFNYQSMFLNSAYAEEPSFLHCVGVALGIDATWALMGSSASTWTLAGMRTAFTYVAKRFLGPISVAIAVVSFVLCMGLYVTLII